MEHMEAEGETIDDAIENALNTLGVEREQVTVEILSDVKKGILGIGARKARVRVSLRRSIDIDQEPWEERQPPTNRSMKESASAVGERGKDILVEILRLMGVQATIEVKPGETGEEIVLDIRGDNGGLLIGRRGQTLEALQYILTRAVGERHGAERPQLIVDTENYHERRKKTLEDMALRLGEKASIL